MTTVLRSASVGADEVVPRVPGFIASSFNPMVYAVAARCLRPDDRTGDGTGDRTGHGAGDGLALVLGTLMGDTVTTDLHSRRLVDGQVHNPLLFMQGTANSISGYVAAEFGVTGPVLSLSAWGDPVTPLLDTAELLLADDRVEKVLLIGVELARTARPDAAWQELTTTAPTGPPLPEHDVAVALLLGRGGPALPRTAPLGRDGVRGLLSAAGANRQPQGASRC